MTCSPHCLTGSLEMMLADLPVPAQAARMVASSRDEVRAVLGGTDDRLMVISGPCSVHDPSAALDYAARLSRIGLAEDLLLVMRVYLEKPRTMIGWTGLLNDPDMDGSHDLPSGLRAARQLLLEIVELGMPVGCEWLSPAAPHFLGDLVAWGAVGARTVESQVHRQLASGLPMPVGFKNATDGDIQVAAEACVAAASGHTYLGVTEAGTLGVVTSKGNPDCHVVLRGGRGGPNFEQPHVAKALDMVSAIGQPRRVVIDASHANSGKDHTRQPAVAAAIASQIAAGEREIAGVMLESFLVAGRQEPGDLSRLVYGQSVTDACMDFATTAQVLQTLAEAVRLRRKAAAARAEEIITDAVAATCAPYEFSG